ncbi:MAG: ComEC/Rec2 family competence protein, partial [Clostridia bacterium]|nr:ComEC/Rec2 family competence protein [Clostridia bacterium]
DDVEESQVILIGRVCDLGRNGEPSRAVYLEDCVDTNGTKYSGRVQTYIFAQEVTTGDIVTLKGTINSTYPIKGEVETYYLRYNVNFQFNTEQVLSVDNGALKLDETIRKYIYDVSMQYSPRNGDVLYALLTGDRNALSEEKESYFKSAGIIHLLAVSGLHVGFVVAVLCFVLKRFKLHPLIECSILLAPLIFYAYICNFTPSVIRAIVMVVCSYLARAVFGKYDLLTSLSWAVVVLLLIFPFNLFDVGFQLSVLSVYGIATAYSSFNRFLTKRNIPKFAKYFIDLLAISLSCSFATFFTMQLNYGYAPIMGIILNIVAIPLVTVAFVLGWVGMLPWIFHYVLYAVDLILEVVVIIAKWVAGLSIATISVTAIAVSVIVVVAWLFVIGGYVNLRKLGKIIAHSLLACLLILCVGLSFVKTSTQTQIYVAYGYDDVTCVATSSGGEVAVVSNFEDDYAYNQVANCLNKYKVVNCTLYIVEYSKTDRNVLTEVLNNLSVQSVYKLDFSYNPDADAVFAEFDIPVYQQMENTSQGNNVSVTTVYDAELRAVIISCDGMSVASLYGDDVVVAKYLDYGVLADFYILPTANQAYSSQQLTTITYYQSSLPYNYGANKYGNFTFTQKGDKISIKFR